MNSKIKTKDMAFIALFAILIAVCSWFTIPTTIPFTMQTFGVFLALLLLGGKKGTLSILVYLLMGLIGLPVFSGGRGGIGVLAGATGGYLSGLMLSGLVLWGLESILPDTPGCRFFSMVSGLLACYALGTGWFLLAYASGTGWAGLWSGLCLCVFPFLLPDLLKLLLADWFARRLSRMIRKMG